MTFLVLAAVAAMLLCAGFYFVYGLTLEETD